MSAVKRVPAYVGLEICVYDVPAAKYIIEQVIGSTIYYNGGYHWRLNMAPFDYWICVKSGHKLLDFS